MFRTAVLAALAFACLASSAEARAPQPVCIETGTVMRPSCMGNDFLAGVKSIKVRMHRDRRATSAKNAHVGDQASIVAHPPGCPARAFCGCGAAVRIFGRPIRALWLAANWFHFPRTSPAPGMAAVKRHHVMVLEADLGGGVWRVFDANSGRHMTKIHARSIAGFAIVNPLGAS